MKKMLVLLLVVSVALVSLMANGTTEVTAAEHTEPVPVKPQGTTELVWWTYYGKANAAFLQKIIDAFNESQTDYHLTIEYQGSKKELIAKMQSTIKDELPSLFNCEVDNLGMLVSSDFCIDAQVFLDKDPEGWPELDDTYAAVRKSYSDQNGNIVGFPNGVSYPTIFYNKDMLEGAGIDPMSLTSLEKVCEASRKLVDGGFCKYAIGFHPDGYYIGTMLGREGVCAYDNDNGYLGNITKCYYQDGGEIQGLMTSLLGFYKDMYADDLAMPYGSNYSSDIIPHMATGDCAMLFGKSSMTTKLLGAVAGKFEVGIIPCSSITENGKRTGEPSGGTGLFIADNGDYWQMYGAYDFMKFCSKPQWSGFFAAATGYMAPTDAAYNTEVYQEYKNKTFPAVSVAYDSLAKSDDSAKMPLCGFSSTIGSANGLAVSTVANNPTDETVHQALATAYETIQDAIELYNLSNL
ncbi:MAG: extracellular solute-binding protein [Sphaerochaetaceae bacterium]|nr:extracellular solute-binding protein [Sphaerochaetaceae bacterium]MDD4007910.1 extracellular solute-binding protein [Sphaerochaetaceae bacterium]MDD4396954.1 extracellular solute-binding protein [Sphaerochaetaceae bacterium]